jgi:pilus assembly protein CpaE
MGMLLAVVGVGGGVGSSTVASGLSGGLARHTNTALLDLDTVAPSLAVTLDLNPARNLSMIANDPPGDDFERWTAVLESEVQPLDPDLPRGLVLAGTARPGAALGVDWVRQLLRQAQLREQFVIADVGAHLHASTTGSAVQAAVLAAADRVLVVASPEIVGLRRTAALLERLRAQLGGPPERIALVLNRHDDRYHHAATEIAEVLGVSVAAVIPEDRDGVQRALAGRRVVTSSERNGRRSAATALLELAERIAELCGQKQSAASRRLRWLSRLAAPRNPWKERS